MGRKKKRKLWRFKSNEISYISNFDNELLQSIKQQHGTHGFINDLKRLLQNNRCYFFATEFNGVDFILSLTERDKVIIKKIREYCQHSKLQYEFEDFEKKKFVSGEL